MFAHGETPTFLERLLDAFHIIHRESDVSGSRQAWRRSSFSISSLPTTSVVRLLRGRLGFEEPDGHLVNPGPVTWDMEVNCVWFLLWQQRQSDRRNRLLRD